MWNVAWAREFARRNKLGPVPRDCVAIDDAIIRSPDEPDRYTIYVRAHYARA